MVAAEGATSPNAHSVRRPRSGVIETIRKDTRHVVETMSEGRALADRTQQLAMASAQELTSIEHKVGEISRYRAKILRHGTTESDCR